MKIALQTKLFTLFLIIALIPIIILSYVSYINFGNALKKDAIGDIQSNSLLKAKAIENFLISAKEDLLFLSEFPSLENMINTIGQEGARKAKENLQHEFLAFSRSRKIYYQIRYMDENGQEIVRIDSNSTDFKIIPEEELQNKRERYYFNDTIKLPSGKIFISPLDLNIEHGKIEIPYKPVIRYGAPVFDKNNNKRGIIITNIFAAYFLKDIQEIRSDKITTILVNNKGYYLSHPDKSKEWGFMFKNNKNLKNDFPQLAHKILSGKSGLILEKNNLISFIPIFPGNIKAVSSTGSSEAFAQSRDVVRSEDYFWVMISIIPKSDVFASIIKLKKQILVLGSAITILVVLLSYFISNIVTRDIKDRDELLESLLHSFKGKFGNIVNILVYKSIQKLTNKNSRVIKILPETVVKLMEKKEKLKEKLKE